MVTETSKRGKAVRKRYRWTEEWERMGKGRKDEKEEHTHIGKMGKCRDGEVGGRSKETRRVKKKRKNDQTCALRSKVM